MMIKLNLLITWYQCQIFQPTPAVKSPNLVRVTPVSKWCRMRLNNGDFVVLL